MNHIILILREYIMIKEYLFSNNSKSYDISDIFMKNKNKLSDYFLCCIHVKVYKIFTCFWFMLEILNLH